MEEGFGVCSYDEVRFRLYSCQIPSGVFSMSMSIWRLGNRCEGRMTCNERTSATMLIKIGVDGRHETFDVA